jgi:hypothetical protein
VDSIVDSSLIYRISDRDHHSMLMILETSSREDHNRLIVMLGRRVCFSDINTIADRIRRQAMVLV